MRKRALEIDEEIASAILAPFAIMAMVWLSNQRPIYWTFVFMLIIMGSSHLCKRLAPWLLRSMIARRPALVARVRRAIFESGLFTRFAEEQETLQANARSISVDQFLRWFENIPHSNRQSRNMLRALEKRAMEELSHGEFAEYRNSFGRPLGMYELRTAVLLAIVEEFAVRE